MTPKLLALLAPTATASLLLSWTISSAEITPTQILSLSGELDCGLFGFGVSSAGDFNGDGFEDVLVSAPFSHGLGRVYVYFGGSQADSLPDVVLSAPTGTVYFGLFLSSAGDFNGDGYDDLVVGDNYFSSGFYVYFGGPTGDDHPDLFLFIPFQFLRQPGAIASGDLNGDGYADLIAGFSHAPGDRVLIYYGGPGADGLADLELNATPDNLFYSRIATIDLNGDGTTDVVVGSGSGLRVYFGGSGFDSLEDMNLTGPRIDGDYVQNFASAGDLNGDGSADLMVTTADFNGENIKVHLYLGGAAVDSIPDATLSLDGAFVQFDAPVASMGDVDADGFGDVIIGVRSLDGSGGRLLLYRGGAPMDTLPSASIVMSEPLVDFPFAIAAADVNGDGLLDGLASLVRACAGTNQVLVYDFNPPLPCRAFLQGKNRVIPVGRGASSFCIRFEPVDKSFDPADVDMSTVRLSLNATGVSGSLVPERTRRMLVGDTDGNGIVELPAWFSGADLGSLLGSLRGRHVVSARLEGKLTSLRRFVASVNLTVLGTPNRGNASSTSVSPNPLNPVGTLRFETAQVGNVSVRLFDVSGRLVRTVLGSAPLAAGEHAALIDGKDSRGNPLATGVYFYSIDRPEGTLRGRFVVAK